MNSNNITLSPQFTSRQSVPRYIYHFTNKTNYESMLKDGVIKPHTRVLFGDGIYTVSLANFFKRWKSLKSNNGKSFFELLLIQVSKGEDDIVLLKIPTTVLNRNNLFVRSQNRLSKISKLIKENQLQEKDKTDYMHCLNGAPANEAPKYTSKKEALEYIYKEPIPINNVFKIGEININNILQSENFDKIHPAKSFLTAILKGTPEVKGAELLDC